MWRRAYRVLSNVSSLLLCGLLAGVVVAAVAFPVAAMGGLAAKAGADTFDGLPTDVEVLPSPQITYLYASDGKTVLALLYDENRQDVSITEVADIMQKAIVASEDTRFYEHNGVDMKGIARAFVNNQQGGNTQGASTLTMQYVRQVISYSAKTPQQVLAATEDTPARKLAEIKRALAIEKKLTKQDILERYLNIASFGNGAYGIFAASQVYFGKAPATLTLGEAALLAALPKAPGTYNPADPKRLPVAVARRDNYVLPQMVEMGYITQQQADEVKAAGPPPIVGKRTPQGCTQGQKPELNTGFFCDYLERWWANQEKFGADSYERLNKLRSAGYRITTSLDLQTQAAAMGNINKVMQKKPAHQGMMLAGVEPGTGRVQALAVNRVFSNDQRANGPNTNPTKKAAGIKGNYPNTVVPLMSGGGDVQGYQAGSMFKFLTIMAALERGLPLDYSIDTVSPYHSKYPVSNSSPAKCPEGPYYCPENSGKKGMGRRNMWTGLGSSVNTYFVPLQERIGTEYVVNAAQRLGIEFHAEEDRALARDPHTWGAFTLGVTSQTPLEMANAFAALVADGKYCKPTPLLEIRDNKGNKIDGAEPDCKQVTDPDVARGVIDAARCPLGDSSAYGRCGGATAGNTRGIVGKPVSGKTGTTDEEKSATLVISTKQLTMAGFYTDPDWPQTREHFEHNDGVNPVVQYAMRDAMAGKPAINFTRPSTKIAFGVQVGIPNVKCNTVADARRKLVAAGFSVSIGRPVGSECPKGRVAGTDPSGRTAKGSVVVLQISNGGPPAPSPSRRR
jgi:membrane peptidoglycan carboxypeptidase